METCPKCGQPINALLDKTKFESMGEMNEVERIADPCELEGDDGQTVLVTHE